MYFFTILTFLKLRLILYAMCACDLFVHIVEKHFCSKYLGYMNKTNMQTIHIRIDMRIRRVHKTSSYACLRFTLEQERQTITVSGLSAGNDSYQEKQIRAEAERVVTVGNFKSGGRMASPRS